MRRQWACRSRSHRPTWLIRLIPIWPMLSNLSTTLQPPSPPAPPATAHTPHRLTARWMISSRRPRSLARRQAFRTPPPARRYPTSFGSDPSARRPGRRQASPPRSVPHARMESLAALSTVTSTPPSPTATASLALLTERPSASPSPAVDHASWRASCWARTTTAAWMGWERTHASGRGGWAIRCGRELRTQRSGRRSRRRSGRRSSRGRSCHRPRCLLSGGRPPPATARLLEAPTPLQLLSRHRRKRT